MKPVLIRVQYKIAGQSSNKVLEFEKRVDVEDLIDSFPKELLESRHEIVNEVLGAKGVWVDLSSGDGGKRVMLIKIVQSFRKGVTLKYAKDMVDRGFLNGYMCIRVTSGTVHQAIEYIEDNTPYKARAMNEDELQVSEIFSS